MPRQNKESNPIGSPYCSTGSTETGGDNDANPIHLVPNETPYDQDDGDGNSQYDGHPFDEKDRKFFRIGIKTTICLITCECGLEVVGESACVDADAYDAETGKKYAYADATNKRKEYEGVYNNV